MNIKRITGENFIGHDKLELELPDEGVVLVTGPNGSGKSSFVEAVPVTLYGKTLRGTNPWAGKGAFIEVDTGDSVIRRARKGQRSVVTVEGGAEYDTATKAQEFLDEEYGSFDAWRRTHVFSSQDAAHFTMSTDGERKKLLETLLDLGRFDGALKQCRTDLKVAIGAVQTLERKKISLAGAVDHKVGERTRLRKQLDEMEDPAASTVDQALVAREKELKAQLQANAAEQRQIENTLTNLAADERVARQQLARVDKDECPTCEQSIPSGMRALAKQGVEEVVSNNEALGSEAKATLHVLKEGESAIRKEGKATSDKLHTQQVASRAAKQVSDLRTKVEAQLDSLKAAVDKAFIDLEETEEELENATKEQAMLQACDQVLGLKGVRAHVLGSTLGGIEAVANSWLARIAGDGLELRLSPYKEKKSGGVSDAISLEVEGAGGGFGYRAASGGERRRIDVALLLALADVSAAAHGHTGGTLFFDEVFDSLDEDGIVATIEAIHDLSEERAVLVISHNENFAARLGPQKHVRL